MNIKIPQLQNLIMSSNEVLIEILKIVHIKGPSNWKGWEAQLYIKDMCVCVCVCSGVLYGDLLWARAGSAQPQE